MKVELEQAKLQVIREGKLSPGASVYGKSCSFGSVPSGLDVMTNMSLMPEFNWGDPDSLFTL